MALVNQKGVKFLNALVYAHFWSNSGGGGHIFIDCKYVNVRRPYCSHNMESYKRLTELLKGFKRTIRDKQYRKMDKVLEESHGYWSFDCYQSVRHFTRPEKGQNHNLQTYLEV
jgi:hypothetical protein